jgi:EF-hand domain pair/EF hand
MKIKRICGIATSIAVTGLMVSGIAFAQAVPTPARDAGAARASGLDKNGDGLLAKEEVAQNKRLAKQFDTIDRNKDGKLSKDELRTHRDAAQTERKAKLDEHFKSIDKDGDGALTKAEAAKAKHLSTNFDQIDANKDGKLSKEELQASKVKHQNRRPGGKQPAAAATTS